MWGSHLSLPGHDRSISVYETFKGINLLRVRDSTLIHLQSRFKNAFFQGRVIAITGAASGIGYAVAQHLAKLGAQLSITDLSAEGLDNCANSLKTYAGDTDILVRAANICDREAVETWIIDTVKHFGRLDGAVNAAGAHPRESGKESIWNVTDDDWEFAQNVNVRGALNLIRAQLRLMVDAVSCGKMQTGSIVLFGSNASVVGMPNLSAYTTSKHALLGLMRAAAMDAAPYNIRVNAICPGPIDTPMLRNAVPEEHLGGMASSIPLKRLGNPEGVAGFVAFLLSEDSEFCTGAAYMMDGGLTAQ